MMEKVLLRRLGTPRRQAFQFRHSDVTRSIATRALRVSSKTTIGAHQTTSAVSRGSKPTCKRMTTSSNYVISPGDSQTMTLLDGRKLGYAIWGSRSPNAMIICFPHGLPGSRLSAYWWDQWGKQTGHTLVCPERPGYGLSTLKRNYTVLEHGRDILGLMTHLGHRRYKVFGISNGGPYALALAHLAPKKEVTGVLLVCPKTPPEGPRTGQTITSFFWHLKLVFLPKLAESNLRKQDLSREQMKQWARYPSNEIVRRWPNGDKYLEDRESESAFAGRIADQRATDVSWGFKCEDVDANKIFILAGGLDQNTPSAGAQYMRNRLRNCILKIEPGEDHFSLQQNHHKLIRQLLVRL